MINKDDEIEFERTTRAIGISRPRRGRVDIAIDFSSQVYGFSGYKTNEHTIYNCEKYYIRSDSPSISTDINKLHEKTNFYNTRRVYVNYQNDPRTFLLEDEAYKWSTSSDRVLSDFESKDFLEQVFITHSIWRLRNMADSLGPYNEIRKQYFKEDSKVRDAMLRVFEPKICELSEKFQRIFPQIDYGDILSQVYLGTLIMLEGENSDHIKSVNEFINLNPKLKQQARIEFRKGSIHPLKTRKNSNNKNIDLQTIASGAIEQILTISKNLSTRHGEEFGVENLLLMFEPKAYASFLSSSINYNSERVYKPWFDENIVDFIFGKKQRLWNRLSDYFKSEIKRERRKITIEAKNFNGSWEENETDEVAENFDSFDYNGGDSSRRWNKYKIPKEVDPKFSSIIDQLPKKQKEVYLAFTKGEYNSKHTKDRQNLFKAKKKLEKMGLTASQIPFPKRRV